MLNKAIDNSISILNNSKNIILQKIIYELSQLEIIICNDNIILLEDSDYIDFLHQQTLNTYIDMKILHYIITTPDEIIEILSCNEPIINICQ